MASSGCGSLVERAAWSFLPLRAASYHPYPAEVLARLGGGLRDRVAGPWHAVMRCFDCGAYRYPAPTRLKLILASAFHRFAMVAPCMVAGESPAVWATLISKRVELDLRKIFLIIRLTPQNHI